jgi:Gpi18-like mannosyltransferase
MRAALVWGRSRWNTLRSQPGGVSRLALLVAVAVLGLAVRKALFPFHSSDYLDFLRPWYDHLAARGFAGLGDEFANYNVPYLYLLLASTALPLEPLTSIKLISVLFDVLLAVAGALIVWRLGRGIFRASLCGIVLFMLPTVLLNGAMWGQADSIFAAFVLLSVAAALRRRGLAAWVWFAVALAFKLQAVFLLPWIVVLAVVQRHRWWWPAAGLGVFLLLDVPAMIAGRSPASLAAVYTGQAETYRFLTLRAATIYQWVPDTLYDLIRPAGLLFAMAVAALLCLVFLERWRAGLGEHELVVAGAASFALVVPLVLPQMHERYFFLGEVLVAVLAMAGAHYILPAMVLQLTGILAYSEFLFLQSPPIPLPVLTVVQLFTVVALVAQALGFRVRGGGHTGAWVGAHGGRPEGVGYRGTAESDGTE